MSSAGNDCEAGCCYVGSSNGERYRLSEWPVSGKSSPRADRQVLGRVLPLRQRHLFLRHLCWSSIALSSGGAAEQERHAHAYIFHHEFALCRERSPMHAW
jgi:hypothetical protein